MLAGFALGFWGVCLGKLGCRGWAELGWHGMAGWAGGRLCWVLVMQVTVFAVCDVACIVFLHSQAFTSNTVKFKGGAWLSWYTISVYPGSEDLGI